MGKPAARITDMHTCPMVTGIVPHVGGPIVLGSFNVFTGKLPQARVGDMAVCVGPPDVIALGSTGVFVNKMAAARMGDLTAHGGVIAIGLPTVLIGEVGGGGGGGAAGLMGIGMASRGFTGGEVPNLSFADAFAMAQALVQAAKNGTPFCEICWLKSVAGKLGKALTKTIDALATTEAPTTFGKHIKIDGDEAFRRQTYTDLSKIEATATGAKLLKAIEANGKSVTIKATSKGNSLTGFGPGESMNADGTPGAGSDAIVNYNPNLLKIGPAAWQTRPPGIALAHELIHAQHAGSGTIRTVLVDNDSKMSPVSPGKIVQEMDEEVRTTGIPPYEEEPYTENKIRAEWDPIQSARPWY